MRYMKIGDREIGDGHPCYIVGEIGLNHNGNVDNALALMEMAADAGFDAVKFQKRDPDVCTPRDQRNKMRETPWGYIRYIEYRKRVEFWEDEYELIGGLAKELGIDWFVSVWDEPSVDFMEQYEPLAYKIPSAALTDHDLLRYVRDQHRPIIMSTGMSSMRQISQAFSKLYTKELISLLHCTSTYPCPPEHLNLRMIETFRRIPEMIFTPIGYSGHETSLTQSVAAVALGAAIVERHITLDRTMWGSDQAASVEPNGMRLLVKRIRRVEASMGDGVKRVYAEEKKAAAKLRRK